jgi:hypothetical protein
MVVIVLQQSEAPIPFENAAPYITTLVASSIHVHSLLAR